MFEIGDSLSKEVFDDYLRVLDGALEGGKPFSMVVDGSSPPLHLTCSPNPRWQLQRASACGERHRGIAFVTGTMTRERMQALYAMQVPGVAYAFLPTREEALEWARSAIGPAKQGEDVSERKTVPFMQPVR